MPAALTSKTRGRALKRSSSTVPKMAFEACFAHTLRLQELDEPAHDRIVNAMKQRSLHIPLAAMFKGKAIAKRPNCTTSTERHQWIRDEIVSTQDKSTTRSLRVSHSMLSRGTKNSRNIGSEQQMLYWANFWDNEDATVKQSCGGLGIFASDRLPTRPTGCEPITSGPQPLKGGTIIARGEVDNRLWWPELETLIEDKDGRPSAMFGPISLINAACAEHANVQLEHHAGAVSAKVISGKTIYAGEELLAHYPCGGLEPCVCRCGKRIRQRRDSGQ